MVDNVFLSTVENGMCWVSATLNVDNAMLISNLTMVSANLHYVWDMKLEQAFYSHNVHHAQQATVLSPTTAYHLDAKHQRLTCRQANAQDARISDTFCPQTKQDVWWLTVKCNIYLTNVQNASMDSIISLAFVLLWTAHSLIELLVPNVILTFNLKIKFVQQETVPSLIRIIYVLSAMLGLNFKLT